MPLNLCEGYAQNHLRGAMSPNTKPNKAITYKVRVMPVNIWEGHTQNHMRGTMSGKKHFYLSQWFYSGHFSFYPIYLCRQRFPPCGMVIAKQDYQHNIFNLFLTLLHKTLQLNKRTCKGTLQWFPGSKVHNGRV